MLKQDQLDNLKNAAEAGGIGALIKAICDAAIEDEKK
jgi:hypothetical protein